MQTILTPKEFRIFEGRFLQYPPEEMKNISEELRVTESRISQIAANLRTRLEQWINLERQSGDDLAHLSDLEVLVLAARQKARGVILDPAQREKGKKAGPAKKGHKKPRTKPRKLPKDMPREQTHPAAPPREFVTAGKGCADESSI